MFKTQIDGYDIELDLSQRPSQCFILYGRNAEYCSNLEDLDDSGVLEGDDGTHAVLPQTILKIKQWAKDNKYYESAR